MTGWVVDVGYRTPCRGENPQECPHPQDDLRSIIYSTYEAAWCGWCGAICLIGPLG